MSEARFHRLEQPDVPSRGSIDIWRFSEISQRENFLDDEERQRLAAYRSPQAQQVFLTGRAGVRLVAARYGGLEPGAVRVRADKNGKPAFVEPQALHFNLSHSGGDVMAAFSGDPVGFDIERRGRAREFEAIAKRFFLPEEAEAVLNAGGGREDVFLKIWTAKEAMVKLTGEGLASALTLARYGPDGQGFLGECPVHLRQFYSGSCCCTVASFFPFEVKGWFDL